MSRPEIRVALLGCAHIPHARSYARALSRSGTGRLVAVYDSSSEARLRLSAEFNVPAVAEPQLLFDDYAAQAVIVCGATAEHRTMVELAAANRAHVLSEKPLACSVADGRAMVQACRRAGVQLHTAFVCRFYPIVLEARKLIQAGELGELRGIVGANRGTPPLAPRYPAWITDPGQAGGGALIDHGVHVVDAMRFLSGANVTRVAAEVGTLFTELEVDDSALLSVVFDNGMVGSIDPSWSVPPGNPWSYDFFLRILGTEGSMSIVTGAESLKVAARIDGRDYSEVSFEPDIDAAMIENFLDSVQGGRLLDPSATGEDGICALQVASAAYESFRINNFVPISGVDE